MSGGEGGITTTGSGDSATGQKPASMADALQPIFARGCPAYRRRRAKIAEKAGINPPTAPSDQLSDTGQKPASESSTTNQAPGDAQPVEPGQYPLMGWVTP